MPKNGDFCLIDIKPSGELRLHKAKMKWAREGSPVAPLRRRSVAVWRGAY
jgi:hypothetical protein